MASRRLTGWDLTPSHLTSGVSLAAMDVAVPDEPPIVARRRVRMALREARNAQNLSQAEVAAAMEWSTAKIMRIETGEVTVTPNDLRALLTYLRIEDHDQVETLVRHAKASRSRRQWWWNEPEYHGLLKEPTLQLIQYETKATAISHFAAMFIPGPLQTKAYARAILARWRGHLPSKYLDALLEVRMRRRRQFLAQEHPPLLRLLLDESLLYRQIGGQQTLAEQLDDLLDVAKSRGAQIRVMPYTLEVPIANAASYDILHLGPLGDTGGERSLDAIVYREHYKDDQVIEEAAEVASHIEIFDSCWNASPDETTSTEILRTRVRQLL